VERNETSNRLAVIGDGHLLAIAHDAEIAAEVIAKFSDASFHGTSMALLRVCI
jgi:hypothetical protein